MTYGESFQNVKPIDDYINFNISFFNEFREYLKERIELEKKNAKESDILLQKYSQKLEKKKQALNLLINGPNVTESSTPLDSKQQSPSVLTPQTPSTPFYENKNLEYFSYIKAWGTLLNQMKENVGKRIKFSEKLAVIIEKMKTQILSKEEEKKKHLQNLKNIHNKIEDYIVEKNNAKKKYFDSCDLLGNQKKKLTRKDSTLSDVESNTDKSVMKIEKSIDGAQVDVDNKKNLYILSLYGLNELKQKVNKEYIPDLYNNLQDCQECIIGALQLFTQDYVKSEQKLTEDIKSNFNNALVEIDAINPRSDNDVFENEKKEDFVPVEIEKFVKFFNENGNFTLTNKSSIFLSNFKDSLKNQLVSEQEKYNNTKNNYNNSKNLYSCINNPSNTDCRSVMEEYTKYWNLLHMEEISIFVKKSKIEAIKNAIGNSNLENSHDFKVQMFINAVCDYCHEKVRGNALKCKSCSFICHKGRCATEVPKRCTGIKVDKKLIYANVNNSEYDLEDDNVSTVSSNDKNTTIEEEKLEKNISVVEEKLEINTSVVEEKIDNNNESPENANKFIQESDESLYERNDSSNAIDVIPYKRKEQFIEDDELSDNLRGDSSERKNIPLNKETERVNNIERDNASIRKNKSLNRGI